MKWIKKLIDRIKYVFSDRYCYDEMEKAGYAKKGKCSGYISVDNHLDLPCYGCEYLDETKYDENFEEDE